MLDTVAGLLVSGIKISTYILENCDNIKYDRIFKIKSYKEIIKYDLV